jgi:hypothetical protein
MRNQYLINIEKELDRLWVGHQHVMVVKLGKDKFILSDNIKSVRAKGFQVLRVTKKLADRSGTDKFWAAMSKDLKVVDVKPAAKTL